MTFLIIVLAAVLVISGISKWRMPAELVPWRSDVAVAQAEARTANKPVLLYFTASWCGPCQTMRRQVWSDQRVAAAAAAYAPVKIDIDQHPQLAMQYRVESVPMLVVLEPDGRIVRGIDHALEADEMVEWLNRPRAASVSTP